MSRLPRPGGAFLRGSRPPHLKGGLPAVWAKAAMTTKARKLERKTRAVELDMEIMRAREANGLPVISPMLGLPPEKWE